MEIKNTQVLHIISLLNQNGFKALVAGGAVRDFLQGLPFDDCDILTDASIEQIKDVFSTEDVRIVGRSFEIALVNKIEVCSARGSKENLSFPENDLGKRDFTINSMAFDFQKKRIIDLFFGKEDLKNRVIRFTGDPLKRIEEDPLRIVRACRIASLIKGDIEPLSKSILVEKCSLVKSEVAPERIRTEILKAMSHEKPSMFFRYLHRIHVLKYIFPCLEQCFDLDGGPHHGETVFEHCMMTGDAISYHYPLLRLAGFLHDTGKYDAAVVKDGNLTFPGHEKYTDNIIADLENLRFSNKEIEYIVAVTNLHMRPLKTETTPKAVRKILRDLNARHINYHDFMRMRIADKKANLAKEPYSINDLKIRLNKILKEISSEQNPAFSITDLEISGEEIMEILAINQGPLVGEILTYLFDKVIEKPLLNNRADLEKLIREY